MAGERFLYNLKTSKSCSSSDDFRGYKKGTADSTRLIVFPIFNIFVPMFHPVKTTENVSFFGVFRDIKMEHWTGIWHWTVIQLVCLEDRKFHCQIPLFFNICVALGNMYIICNLIKLRIKNKFSSCRRKYLHWWYIPLITVR